MQDRKLPLLATTVSILVFSAVMLFSSSDSKKSHAQEGTTQERVELKFRPLASTPNGTQVRRAKIAAGWLVLSEKNDGTGAGGITFVPDPHHEWDGRGVR